jgi:hypothetical protein
VASTFAPTTAAPSLAAPTIYGDSEGNLQLNSLTNATLVVNGQDLRGLIMTMAETAVYEAIPTTTSTTTTSAPVLRACTCADQPCGTCLPKGVCPVRSCSGSTGSVNSCYNHPGHSQFSTVDSQFCDDRFEATRQAGVCTIPASWISYVDTCP